MKITRKMKVRLGIVATAAALCLGVIPSGTRALFGRNSQNREDSRRNQDPGAQDRDSQRDRDATDDSVTVTLPSGYLIPVRLAADINSNHDKGGDLFTRTVDPSVLVHDHVVIPRGTEAHIRMVEAKKGGKVKGKAKVRLELVSLIMNGERLGVDTSTPSKEKEAGSPKISAERERERERERSARRWCDRQPGCGSWSGDCGVFSGKGRCKTGKPHSIYAGVAVYV